jgi:glycosyltransferase involved in cell wall biosynthesis
VTVPQRVGVNLLWLVPGVVGGSEEYTVRTLDGILDVAPPDIDLVLFALRPFIEAHPELTDRIDTVTLSLTGRDKSVRVAAESSWLAFQCRRQGVAMVHHAGGILPAVRAVPGLLTVHDVQPLLQPENFSPAKRAFSRAVLPRSAKAARLVVTPSEYSRQALLSVVDLPPEHVWIVPHGIPDPSVGPGRDVDLAQVEAAFGITAPFFVYPAITYPHKNHLTLVRAFAGVVRQHPEASLVLTGGEGQMEGEILETISALGLEGRVHRLGRIPWWDLAAILRQARGLGFPSRFEGFGAPVIEAMARGCPVVAADSTALPEVVGDAGVLVDADDQAAWTTELLRLLDDDEHHARLVAAGRARAAQFSAVASAEALLAAYHEVLSGS